MFVYDMLTGTKVQLQRRPMSYRDEKAVDSAFHACYSNGSIYRKLSSIPRTSLEYNLIQKIKHLAYLIEEMIEVERSAKTEIEVSNADNYISPGSLSDAL